MDYVVWGVQVLSPYNDLFSLQPPPPKKKKKTVHEVPNPNPHLCPVELQSLCL